MDLSIDRSSATPVYRQIVDRLRAMIASGRLPVGFRLPPERRLAEALGVNRSTVLAAYRELKGDGLLAAHVGRGTVVSAPLAGVPAPATERSPLPWRQLLGRRGEGRPDPLIRDLLALTERPDVISMAAGLPAPELLPVGELGELAGRLVAEVGAPLFAYSPCEGHTPLRESVAHWLAGRGICCDPAEVLILAGSQQGLDLTARLLLEPGDAVVVEEPTYIGALEVFRRAGARLVGVPCDGEGLISDALEVALERHHPRLIYTLPTFQNPAGTVMSSRRRERLLELAARHRVPVLEDDPYADLRYEGDSLPSLKALDRDGQVLYLGTFSKVLAPGLRIGFLVAPRPAVGPLTLAKQTVDLHANTLGQRLVDRFLRDGRFERHLSGLRLAYRRRRDALAAALAATDLPGLAWSLPSGGFYIWARLPDGVDRPQLVARAAEARVAFLPGWSCFAQDGSQPFVRLSFSYLSEEQLAAGVERFAAAIRAATSHSDRRRKGPAVTPTLV